MNQSIKSLIIQLEVSLFSLFFSNTLNYINLRQDIINFDVYRRTQQILNPKIS
jgi:hypothetical protein